MNWNDPIYKHFKMEIEQYLFLNTDMEFDRIEWIYENNCWYFKVFYRPKEIINYLHSNY